MFDGIGANPAYTRTTPAYNPQQTDNRPNNARAPQSQAQQAESRTQGQQANSANRAEQAEAAVQQAQQTPFSTMAAQPMTGPNALQAAQVGASSQPSAVSGLMAQATMTQATTQQANTQTFGASANANFGETVQSNGTLDATDPANRGSHIDTEI